MTQLRSILEEKGFFVYIVPEAATMLMKGGAIIDTSKLTEQQMFNLQIDLMKVQMALEDRFTSIAENSNFPAVVLCDRGLMDTLAYSGPEVFERILQKTGWTKI